MSRGRDNGRAVAMVLTMALAEALELFLATPFLEEVAVTDKRPAILLGVFGLKDSRFLPFFVGSNSLANLWR